MITYDVSKEERIYLTWDSLEVAMSEFVKKFNFKPTYFIVGVSLVDITSAMCMEERIKSSKLGSMLIHFICDSDLKIDNWYVLSIKNDETYRIMM